MSLVDLEIFFVAPSIDITSGCIGTEARTATTHVVADFLCLQCHTSIALKAPHACFVTPWWVMATQAPFITDQTLPSERYYSPKESPKKCQMCQMCTHDSKYQAAAAAAVTTTARKRVCVRSGKDEIEEDDEGDSPPPPQTKHESDIIRQVEGISSMRQFAVNMGIKGDPGASLSLKRVEKT